MSQQSFVKFLLAARDDPAKRAAYELRNLSQLVFHAKNEGFDFTPEEMAEVVSRLEIGVIIDKDAEPVDGSSSLWREMWGHTHLGYLLDRVVTRHTDDELSALAETNGAALR